MINNLLLCQFCGKKFSETDAYEYIQDDLGHKVYWCSHECLEKTKKSNSPGLFDTKENHN